MKEVKRWVVVLALALVLMLGSVIVPAVAGIYRYEIWALFRGNGGSTSTVVNGGRIGVWQPPGGSTVLSNSNTYGGGGSWVFETGLNFLPVLGAIYYAECMYKAEGVPPNSDEIDSRFEFYSGDGAGLNYVFFYPSHFGTNTNGEWIKLKGIIRINEAPVKPSYRIRNFIVVYVYDKSGSKTILPVWDSWKTYVKDMLVVRVA